MVEISVVNIAYIAGMLTATFLNLVMAMGGGGENFVVLAGVYLIPGGISEHSNFQKGSSWFPKRFQ